MIPMVQCTQTRASQRTFFLPERMVLVADLLPTSQAQHQAICSRKGNRPRGGDDTNIRHGCPHSPGPAIAVPTKREGGPV